MKEPLRAQIEAAAQERGVSMNAEAVLRLEASFRDEGIANHLRSALEEMSKRIAALEAARCLATP